MLVTEWSWVLALRLRSLGDFHYLILHELGGLLWTSVLNLALPSQRHSPDAWLEHQEPVLHTVQNKREKRKKERKKKIK